jgi:3-phenylpropionate/trans-cinnamate dioxygenase ferredoxin subunit
MHHPKIGGARNAANANGLLLPFASLRGPASTPDRAFLINGRLLDPSGDGTRRVLDMAAWIEACGVDDIDAEDVIRFDHGGRTYAVYRSPDDEYFATDGLCTHEKVHLADGLVMDDIIECPKHNGRFNYKTGEAKGAPVCVNLKTYPVRVENDRVFVEI